MSKSSTATKKAQKTETNVVNKEQSLTGAQTKQINALSTVSARIRYLDNEGYSRSQIAAALGKRYQHVRNVLITPITKAKA